jgi:hypothetical protein
VLVKLVTAVLLAKRFVGIEVIELSLKTPRKEVTLGLLLKRPVGIVVKDRHLLKQYAKLVICGLFAKRLAGIEVKEVHTSKQEFKKVNPEMYGITEVDLTRELSGFEAGTTFVGVVPNLIDPFCSKNPDIFTV